MPKTTWEVDDERKLRGALESTASFANESYNRLWAVPRMGGPGTNDGSTFQWATYELADGATKNCRFGFIIPENWKRGVIKYRWHLAAITGSGVALDFRVRHRSRKTSFTDHSVGVGDILNVTETWTHTDGGGATAWDIYEPTGWDTKIDLDTYQGVTAELTRYGADGLDTSTAILKVIALELIFYPDARP
jgi:hypothetical protein